MASLPKREQRFVFKGKNLLNGNKTLAEYGIEEGSSLRLMMRLLGD